jgi:uncharacterized repeat protein (TIGR03803 family)
LRAFVFPAGRNDSGFTVIHMFTGGSGDGAYPYGGLIKHGGSFYGTTAAGGGTNVGTVFTVTPVGGVTLLHSFSVQDGSQPWAAPTFVNGTLFGTTAAGGNGGFNAGEVYEIESSGQLRVVLPFDLDMRGGEPYAGVTQFYNGIYGTAYKGGNSNRGAVYFIHPDKAWGGAHDFGGSVNDGMNPYASLTRVGNTLYGTASGGGAYGGGTAYVLGKFSGSYETVYSFGGTSGDGTEPRGKLVSIGGNLYGSTEYGGSSGHGTVFVISASGSERVLYSFGSVDAQNPIGDLSYFHGALLGSGYAGGAHGKGGIFKVDLSGNETLLHSFSGKADGSGPRGSLVVYKGRLYGAASFGGASNDGTIFSIKP